MTAATRVIGIGQPAAGDDFAGIAVARALRGDGRLPAGVELHETTDPARLVDLLAGARRAILVDALVDGEPPGTVTRLTPESLARLPRAPYSSHGLGVAEAVALARALAPDPGTFAVDIVAISIAPPVAPVSDALSPAVAAALPQASGLVLDLLAREDPKN